MLGPMTFPASRLLKVVGDVGDVGAVGAVQETPELTRAAQPAGTP